MKKLTSATDLGGAPIFKNDLRAVFNQELYKVIQGLLYPFDADVEGIIISGCLITANGGNFDMTAGIIYINGEYREIPAATNQTFTKYIIPSTLVTDSRTFADGTSHAVTETKNAELAASAPMSGQYITINSLTGADDRRWRGGNLITRIVTLDIGDWNMDSTAGVVVTAPAAILAGKVRGIISVSIRPDTGVALQSYYDLANPSTASVMQGGYSWGIATPTDPAAFSLTRLSGGIFDGTDFDATSFNRGTISFLYEG
jgi:hypothetical protein